MQFTGVITKVELREFEPFEGQSRYRQFSEDKDVKLLVAMDTDQGTVWFFTPAARKSVTCPPGAGIAVCTLRENEWIGSREASQDKVLGVCPEPKIAVGQTITIEGRFKKDTQYGKQLNYVKLG